MAETFVVEREAEVLNELGIHARPASILAKKAKEFSCRLFILSDGDKADLSSMMSILMLAAAKGRKLIIRGEGDDAEAAVNAVVELFNTKFGEE
ncbi:MAG: HPr family phosphocarrier protein [Victivallaceae bacterium]